jgi:hypothetical protein
MWGMVRYRRAMSCGQRHSKMTVKRGCSSVAALVMARAAQRMAAQNNDPAMAADAKEYENRALAAIKQGQSELFPLEKPKPAAFQLRLPGF